MHLRFFTFLSVLALAALWVNPSAAHAANAPQPGRIVAAKVQGEAYAIVHATNTRTVLSTNAELSEGASVTTGLNSSVVLVFSNGSTINLGAEAELDIEAFTQNPFDTPFNVAGAKEEPSASTTKLKLNRGELVGHVAKLHRAEGSTFEIKTPVGAAGIRGTIFRIVYTPDGAGNAVFSMTTLEGSVEVTLINGTVNNVPVQVSSGTEVSVTVEVTTDAAGNITVTLPSGASTVIATTASAGTLQQVTDTAQKIAQAIAELVITPPAPPPASAAEPAAGETKTEPTKQPEKTTPTIPVADPRIISPSTL